MNRNDEDFFFFPEPFVYHYAVPEHSTIAPQLVQTLEQYDTQYHGRMDYLWYSNTPECSGVCTNFRNSNKQTQWYTQQHLKCFIWNPVKSLLSKLGVSEQKLSLKKIWWNVYQSGDFAPLHNHGTCGISGVYILELNELNKTVFVHPTRSALKPISDDNYHYTTESVKEGTVLLFPAALNHYVEPARSRRMSISFNVDLKDL